MVFDFKIIDNSVIISYIPSRFHHLLLFQDKLKDVHTVRVKWLKITNKVATWLPIVTQHKNL